MEGGVLEGGVLEVAGGLDVDPEVLKRGLEESVRTAEAEAAKRRRKEKEQAEREEKELLAVMAKSLEEDQQQQARRPEEVPASEDSLSRALRASSELWTTGDFVRAVRGALAALDDMTMDKLESTSYVRGANRQAEGCPHQKRAQYGRLQWAATQKMFELVKLKRREKFVDVGHGVGNVVMQAAATIGCESWGIEVVHDRWLASQQLWDVLGPTLAREANIGACRLEKKDLVDSVDDLAACDVAYVNNYNGVFAEKAQGSQVTEHLDTHVVRILGKMRVGSRVLTLHPLPLVQSRTDVNTKRRRNGLPEKDDASFFDLETFTLEPSTTDGWAPEIVRRNGASSSSSSSSSYSSSGAKKNKARDSSSSLSSSEATKKTPETTSPWPNNVISDNDDDNSGGLESVVSWGDKPIDVYLYTRIKGPGDKDGAPATPGFRCATPSCPLFSLGEEGFSVAFDDNGRLNLVCVYCETQTRSLRRRG